MTAYLVRRLLSGVLLIVALTLATYLVFFEIPVDPADLVLRGQGTEEPTEEQVEKVHRELGLDEPVLRQYAEFVWRLATEADLGRSYFGRRPVNDMIASSLGPTASLVLLGAIFLLLLSVPLALVSAVRAHSFADRGVLAVSLVGIALHPFVLGLGLREIFADELSLAPKSGYCHLRAPPPPEPPYAPPCSGPLEWAQHLWLPALTFALFFLPMYTRMVRARLLETFGEQYVIAARARGASEVRVLRAHVLPNAIVPVLAMLAMDAGTAITAAIYVETIYSLNGIGRLAVSALSGDFGGYDLPVVVGIVFTVAVAVLVLNLAADLVSSIIDPRIRAVPGRASG